MSTKSHDQVSGSFMAGYSQSKKSNLSKKENKNLTKVSREEIMAVIEQIKEGEGTFYKERDNKI